MAQPRTMDNSSYLPGPAEPAMEGKESCQLQAKGVTRYGDIERTDQDIASINLAGEGEGEVAVFSAKRWDRRNS